MGAGLSDAFKPACREPVTITSSRSLSTVGVSASTADTGSAASAPSMPMATFDLSDRRWPLSRRWNFSIVSTPFFVTAALRFRYVPERHYQGKVQLVGQATALWIGRARDREPKTLFFNGENHI